MCCSHGLVPYDERTAATRELEVRKCGSDMPGFQSDAAFTGDQPPSPRSGAASCSFACSEPRRSETAKTSHRNHCSGLCRMGPRMSRACWEPLPSVPDNHGL